MKKTVVMLALVGTMMSTAMADVDSDKRLERQCEYALYNEGYYNDLLSGYTLGIVQGIKSMIPIRERSDIAKRRLGYITDTACLKALSDTSRAGFESKFIRAAYRIMKKK